MARLDKWWPTKANRHGAANRGWSNKGCLSDRYLLGNPLRQNALWNPKECYDLLDAYTSGVSLRKLAEIHQRKQSSIETQLPRALVKAENYINGLC